MSRWLSPELREFIYRYSPSPAALTVLVHLQAHPKRGWTPHELHLEIPDLDERQAADVLAVFYGQGLLTAGANSRYQYKPSSPEVDRLAAVLARTYAERPAAILKEITDIAHMAPLRSFADAFVIKKERKDG